MLIRILLLLILFVTSNANSCELTEEYKAARIEAYRTMHSSYSACRKSSRSAAYWRNYVNCIEQHGENTGTYCKHVNLRKKENPKDATKHCEILNPTAGEVFKYFQEVINEKRITKCVTPL